MNKDFNFKVKRKRPEELYSNVFEYFNHENVVKYAKSKSLMRIQEKIVIRALELLDLQERRSFILDAGSGPGFAAIYLNEIGMKTIALDLIKDFLTYYDLRDLNPIVADMCYLPFKPETFDGIISISALQWVIRDLDKQSTKRNIINLAKTCYLILKPHSKAIFQFYPKNHQIMKTLGNIFINNTSFKGHYVIDNPEIPKKRKMYLTLIKE